VSPLQAAWSASNHSVMNQNAISNVKIPLLTT
jgi:hypothetical protein